MSHDPWKHRSAGMQCRTCMWYCPKVSEDSNVYIGRCRKNAPELGGFPAVFPTDWCGNHRVNENALIPLPVVAPVNPTPKWGK